MDWGDRTMREGEITTAPSQPRSLSLPHLTSGVLSPSGTRTNHPGGPQLPHPSAFQTVSYSNSIRSVPSHLPPLPKTPTIKTPHYPLILPTSWQPCSQLYSGCLTALWSLSLLLDIFLKPDENNQLNNLESVCVSPLRPSNH